MMKIASTSSIISQLLKTTQIQKSKYSLNLLRPLSSCSRKEHDGKKRNFFTNERKTSGLVAVVSGAALGYYFIIHQNTVYATKKSSDAPPEGYCPPVEKVEPALWRNDLPTYKMEEVRRHHSNEKGFGVWCTYKEGVYDITNFIAKHPGANIILLSAGERLEPFWIRYQFHYNQHQVLELLESYRIGNLCKNDQVKLTDYEDPYVNEPKRHKNMETTCLNPFCGGVKLDLLGESFYTPNEYHYVRSHLPVPILDPKTYSFTLEVEGSESNKLTFTLDDIKKMPKVTIPITLQCSGQRRAEMNKIKNKKMVVQWGPNGCSNAIWTGTRLCDLLKHVFITEDDLDKYKHVQFEGYDKESNGVPYGGSIPLWKAVDKNGDVLLAYEMNGEPLPLDHGYPLRIIVPGHTGARSIKWLKKIIVSNEESHCHYQRIDYKSFGPSVTLETADFETAPAIQVLPINSVCTKPLAGNRIKVVDGKIHAKGYAYSGGGNRIQRVDVTVDGGKTWHVADLQTDPTSRDAPFNWTWALWSIHIPVDISAKEAEIWVKGVDTSCNTQPESWQNIFNFKGCLCNAYHRVKVNLIQGNE